MANKKKLASYVHVDGKVYGPKDDVPADVAKLITNPKAWADGGDAAEADDGDAQVFERVTGDYDKARVPALKAEIAARNEGRDDEDLLPEDGNKADLVAVLEADDAESV